MTTNQFLKTYTVPHLEPFQQFSGEIINGLMMLKSNKKWYTTIIGWCFCLPRRFKRKMSNFTPSFNLPVLTDERFLDWAENHNWKDGDLSEDGLAVKSFLSDLIGKPAVSMCTEMFEQVLTDYVWQTYKNPKPVRDEKWSRAAYRMYDLGWQFDDHFPGIRDAKIEQLEVWKATKELVKKEPSEVEGGIEFLTMLTTFAEHTVVCPFVFPELILNRRDGEIYFINTPDTVYFTIRRSI